MKLTISSISWNTVLISVISLLSTLKYHVSLSNDNIPITISNHYYPSSNNRSNLNDGFMVEKIVSPTVVPSSMEFTSFPTFQNRSVVNETYIQSLCSTNIDILTDEQIISLEVILKLNTEKYGPYDGEPIVQTISTILHQSLYNEVNNCPNHSHPLHTRHLLRVMQQEEDSTTNTEENINNMNELRIVFQMSWSSIVKKLYSSMYINQFRNDMNEESAQNETINQLNMVGVRVDQVSNVRIYNLKTPNSLAPTEGPTSKIMPHFQPVGNQKQYSTNSTTTTVISASVLAPSILGIVFLGFLFLRRRKQQDRKLQIIQLENNNKNYLTDIIIHSPDGTKCYKSETTMSANPVPDEDSISNPIDQNDDSNSAQNKIPVSIESISIDTCDIASIRLNLPQNNPSKKNKTPTPKKIPLHYFYDDTILLKDDIIEDELDRYKNPNLEQVRIEVLSKVRNCENMISHALVRALLMEEEDAKLDLNKVGYNFSTGGGTQVNNQLVIEANFLCETNDWMKRVENPTIDQRNECLQKATNDSVTCVLYNIITPSKASEIIHECSALLQLGLRTDIPETTLVVYGMRKNVGVRDLKKAFRNFGDIKEVAVGSKSRGFGFVRFMSTMSVFKALDTFRISEIVVQDVAVVVRKLTNQQYQQNLLQMKEEVDTTIIKGEEKEIPLFTQSDSSLRRKNIDTLALQVEEAFRSLRSQSEEECRKNGIRNHYRVRSSPDIFSNSQTLNIII